MLRSVILALALATTANVTIQSAHAQAATGDLNIEVSGLAPQGAVMLQLFNSETGYRAGDDLAANITPVNGGVARIAFAGLPPGQYAFRLFHDVNGDQRMNTNPFGIPTEPYAFSNNAHGRFGPATWTDAVFTVSAGGNVQRISLEGSN